MEATDPAEAEEEVVDAVVDLLQADEVVVQGIADVSLVAKHRNRAIAAGATDEEWEG